MAGLRPTVIAGLRRWLDPWSGIDLVAAGMARRAYNLSLTRHDEPGWRATLYVTGTSYKTCPLLFSRC